MHGLSVDFCEFLLGFSQHFIIVFFLGINHEFSIPRKFSIHLLFTSSDDVLELYTGTRKSYLNVEAISASLQKACVDLHGHRAAWI